MTYAKVSSKFQIVLPKKIREAIPINVGDNLVITLEKKKIVLTPKIKVDNPLEILCGSVKSEKDAVEEIRKFREKISNV